MLGLDEICACPVKINTQISSNLIFYTVKKQSYWKDPLNIQSDGEKCNSNTWLQLLSKVSANIDYDQELLISMWLEWVTE